MALFNGNELPKDDEWLLLFDRASNTLGHDIGVILIPLKEK